MNDDTNFYDMPWRERLDFVVKTMHEMSTQSDPQQMVQRYIERIRRMNPTNRMMAISRRDLQAPYYRVTRSSMWDQPINPWKNRSALPLFKGGLIAELIYADKPVIISDLKFSPDDPAREYLEGMRSLQAIPQFDRGESLNMAISLN